MTSQEYTDDIPNCLRMEADLDHASQENDRLHERNMHIEHNLARVNAEKHLAEARCAVNNV